MSSPLLRLPEPNIRGQLIDMGTIRLGTSSWADRLLLASGWYPREANTPALRLAYYAGRFDLVEADTGYYAIPTLDTTTTWAAATPDGFTFDVKVYSLLTGHPTPVATLPADLRPTGTGRQVRRSDLDPAVYDEVWQRQHLVLTPLARAGKLGVLLLQFPPWLRCGAAARHRILDTVQRARPFRVAVELRHRSWFEGANTLETLRLLHDADASFVVVDMPQGHDSSVPPVMARTAEPAVVRFHGHSPAWSTGSKEEKFRYAYGERELADWAVRLRELSKEADSVHVLMNNCCGGQAQRDGARLAELLGIARADLVGRSGEHGFRSTAPRGHMK